MGRVVLVTRPEPGLAETMRAVAALGFEPLAAPMLRIETLHPSLPQRVQAVLLTSGQAAAPLAALAPHLLAVPVLAVGDSTARRAATAGFRQVRSAAADAARLARLTVEVMDPSGGPLLLAVGTGQGAGLARTLRDDGFSVIRRCVYRARRTTGLGHAAVAAFERDAIHAVLFFSAETANTFVRLLPRKWHGSLANTRAITISSRTADCLSALNWQALIVSPHPTAAALIGLLEHPGQDRA